MATRAETEARAGETEGRAGTAGCLGSGRKMKQQCCGVKRAGRGVVGALPRGQVDMMMLNHLLLYFYCDISYQVFCVYLWYIMKLSLSRFHFILFLSQPFLL